MTFPTTSTPEQNVTQGEETRKDRRRRLRKIAQQKRRAKMSEEAKEEKRRKDKEQKRKKRQEEQIMTEVTNIRVSLPRKRNRSTSIANASAGENPQSHGVTSTAGRSRGTDTEVQASLAPVSTEDGELQSHLPREAHGQQQHLFPPPDERLSTLPAPPLGTEVVVSSPSLSGRQQLLPSIPVEHRIIPIDQVTSGTRSIMSPLDVFASAPEMPLSVASENSVVPFPPPLAREEHAMARIQVAAGALRSDLFNDNLLSILLDKDSALSLAFDYLSSLVMKISWITEKCRKKQLKGLLRDFDVAIAALKKRRTEKDGEPLEALKLVKGALRKSSFALLKNHSELAFQLTGRLLTHAEDNFYIESFLDEVHEAQVQPWLCPLTQCLESPTSSRKTVLHADSEVTSVACVGRGDSVVIAYSTWSGNGYIWNGSDRHCLRKPEGEHIKFVDIGSIVVATSTKEIHIYDIERGNLTGVCDGHDKRITSVAVAKRGNVIMSGSWDKSIKVWGIKNAKCVAVLGEHNHRVNSVALTDDGSVGVSGSSDHTVRVWDIKSERCMRVLCHGANVNSVAITNDRSLIISGSDDGIVQSWDAKTGKWKCDFEHGDDGVDSMAVSDDGNTAISVYRDIMLVYNTRNGKCKRVIQDHYLENVALLEDGSGVLSGSSCDRIIQMWKLETEEHIGNDKQCTRGVK